MYKVGNSSDKTPGLCIVLNYFCQKKNSLSTHIHLRSAAHVFTISGIWGVFTVTLMQKVQNYLLMVWC